MITPMHLMSDEELKKMAAKGCLIVAKQCLDKARRNEERRLNVYFVRTNLEDAEAKPQDIGTSETELDSLDRE